MSYREQWDRLSRSPYRPRHTWLDALVVVGTLFVMIAAYFIIPSA